MQLKTIVLLLAVLLIQSEMNAQTNSKYWKNYHLFIGFSAGPAQTTITNHLSNDYSRIETSRENSLCFSFDGGYFFNKYIGVVTGVGLSPFKTLLSIGDYYNTLDTIDSEGDYYERRIDGNDIKEIQKIQYLEFPLMVALNYPYSRIIGLFLQTGVSLSVPIATTYSSSGTFSYSGYYPAYNVVLTDLPYEGFVSNVNSTSQGNLKVKPINPQVVAVGGFYFYPEKQLQISVGFSYKKMLTNISDYPEPSSLQLSIQENQIRSLMEDCSKVSTNSVGIMISLKYFIK